MKRLTFIIGAILLVVNLLLGSILSCYDLFSVCLNCAVIVINTCLLLLIQHIVLKDAFKISLSMLFSVAFAVELILGCFAPSELTNNWFLISCIIIFSFEIIVLLITNKISKQ